jgi:hypothetical protein
VQPISSNPILRILVIAVPGLLVAIVLGSQVGTGSWLLPVSLAAACILFALYILFFRAVTLDALTLGFLLLGYIVGNRGFAALHVGGRTPIYAGEIGLTVCAAILGVRFALRKTKLIPKSALAWAILALLVLGGIRLFLDTVLQPSFANSFTAIRDAATVYYAIFFFIAFALGQNPAGRRVVERCTLVACAVLLPIAAMYIAGAAELFNNVSVDGYPLISHKGDLTTTYLAFGSFYFFLQPARGTRRVFLRVLSLLSFVGMVALTARAALVGFGCAAFILLIARRPQFLFYQIAVAVALLIVIGLLQVSRISHAGGYVSKVLDRVESITDVSGKYSYRGEIGDSSAQNNQFRLVWWESVIDETMDKAPIFGLGFGYDLAKRFLISYEAQLNQYEFDTRSPHSIWVTMVGRMGIIGVISFFLIAVLIFRNAISAAKRVARREAEPVTLGHWCAVLVLLGSASFGVVLEGPMGAIPFWSLLGLAVAEQLKPKTPAEPQSDRGQTTSVPSRALVER